jgi:hypothetical protein
MIRFDQRFSGKTTAFFRFNFDRATSTQPLASSGQYLNDLQQLTSAPVNGGIELMHVFNPNLINEVNLVSTGARLTRSILTRLVSLTQSPWRD